METAVIAHPHYGIINHSHIPTVVIRAAIYRELMLCQALAFYVLLIPKMNYYL
jgi:hypothetical protein